MQGRGRRVAAAADASLAAPSGGNGGSTAAAGAGAAANKSNKTFLTDCHLSVCTLDPPVNLGAPDGRMAHAVMLVMVPEDDLTAPWAQALDRFTTMRTIKSAFKRFAAHGNFLKAIIKSEHEHENDRSRQAFAELFGLHAGGAEHGSGHGSGHGGGSPGASPPGTPKSAGSPGRRQSFGAGGGGGGRKSMDKSGGRKSMDKSTDDAHHQRDKGKMTPTELVESLRSSVHAFAKSEEARLKAAAEGRDVTAGQADPVELYQFSGRFAGGGGVRLFTRSVCSFAQLT